MPGNGRTPAIGLADAELYVAQVRHPPNLSKAVQHIRRNPVVDGQDHHRVAPGRVATDLHAGDVHVVLAEDTADLADHAGAVLVPADQEAAVRDQIDSERIDPHRARL